VISGATRNAFLFFPREKIRNRIKNRGLAREAGKIKGKAGPDFRGGALLCSCGELLGFIAAGEKRERIVEFQTNALLLRKWGKSIGRLVKAVILRRVFQRELFRSSPALDKAVSGVPGDFKKKEAGVGGF